MKKNTLFWSMVAIMALAVMLSLALAVALSSDSNPDKVKIDGDDLHKPSKDAENKDILTQFAGVSSSAAF
jgi:hypothetical protein